MTVARVAALEIAIHWRWPIVLALSTVALAAFVLPAGYPHWDVPTLWITAAAVVMAGEATLLVHELSHAVAAHAFGQQVRRIVFHGLLAETVVGPPPESARTDAAVALAGPAANLILAGFGQALHGVASPGEPLAVLSLLLVLGNLGMSGMSLLPVPGSDGWRAYRRLPVRASIKTMRIRSPSGDQP